MVKHFLILLAGGAVFAGVVFAGAACRVAPTPAAKPKPAAYKAVCIKGVPHIHQRPDFCGEACVAMWLQKLEHKTTQDNVFNASKLDPSLGRGCYAPELRRAMLALGLKSGQTRDIWQTVPAGKGLDGQFKSLHADLLAGVASIVCTRYDDKPGTTEHFRLILGYDPKSDEVIYHEPADADGAYKRMTRAKFLELWPLKYNKEKWTVIRFRLGPGKITPTKTAPPAKAKMHLFTNADYAQHILKLKRKPPTKGLTYIVERPFVVVGNEPPAVVRRRAAGTVRWATRHLKKDYFPRDPNHIITIWLLGDKVSYKLVSKAVAGYEPNTPFGFYASDRRCLIMNIATGGGTLVHEMVHAFMESNFPQYPAWFNEGLASLYEQSGQRNDHIVGYTNWRLAGLQKAIRDKKVPSFKYLTFTNTRQFYHQDNGTNYAQARYLCYYLQQKGKLRAFYKAFLKNHKTDPTGYKTLVEILDVKDMDAFKKQWESYCMKLKFP